MEQLSLVSVNIERSKHLDLVVPFLRESKPDVICIQELCEDAIEYFEKELNMQVRFLPSGIHPPILPENKPHLVGIGILTSLPIQQEIAHYYAGSEEAARSNQDDPKFSNSAVVGYDIEKGGTIFRILNTHFTWTPDGKPSDAQYINMQSLLKFLSTMDEFVLCGDFNAPRGGEIFQTLAGRYRDNIPVQYMTSIDGSLHRAGQLPYMIDGIFSTPPYVVSDVELHFGVSDHAAITAMISTNRV